MQVKIFMSSPNSITHILNSCIILYVDTLHAKEQGQAIDEMVQFSKEDEALLRDELLCFRVLLARAERLPEAKIL